MEETLQTPTEASATESVAIDTNAVGIDKNKVKEVLNMLRPYLQADGGDVELLDVTPDGVVQVRLQGACGTCPSSTYTLKMGLEEQLKQYVPGVTEVVNIA